VHLGSNRHLTTLFLKKSPSFAHLSPLLLRYKQSMTIKKKIKHFAFHGILWSLLAIVLIGIVELGLRAYRSLAYDGGIFLAASSPNYQLHDKYGWISRSNFSHKKNNDFYGKGIANYNAEGFRARPLAEAAQADFKVCILGDSYMQGHQMPDGEHLPHLLEEALKKRFQNPYVLPLAVGGYGSLQQLMLFEDFGIPFQPDLIIQQWCSNDVINNSYFAEKYNFGNNNVLRRPYLEEGEIVYRRPYRLHISDWVDNLVIVKVINILLARQSAKKVAPEELAQYLEKGWEVADICTKKIISSGIAPYIALVPEEEQRAIDLFQSNGAFLCTYTIYDEHKNLPVDNHPNGAGHQVMLENLLPLIIDSILLIQNNLD